MVPLSVISFAPGITNTKIIAEKGYPLVKEDSLIDTLKSLNWVGGREELYQMTLSAIENLSSIRKSRFKREVHREDSRGAKLKRLEDSIATQIGRAHV